MNEMQQQFYNFILLRVQDSKKDEAKELLTESFQKQNDRTFNKEYMETFIPRMKGVLKQEYIEEVVNIMQQFASKNAE